MGTHPGKSGNALLESLLLRIQFFGNGDMARRSPVY